MITLFPSGDSAFLLKFGNNISEEIHSNICAFIHILLKEKIKGITEVVPSYTDILIHYNPLEVEYKKLVTQLKKLSSKIETICLPEPRTVRIPVLYGGKFGKDLEEVKKHSGLTKEEIIQLHSQKKYLVYMLGFTPGFCYLGGMNKRLATPRKKIPEQKIVAGSVGIAAEQTGIYPIDSPGGWQIIGRTPLKLFNPAVENPFLIEAGNYIEFYSITEEDYNGYDKNC
jgi:KipI family sensor histidine kinase inhibitor